MNKCEMWILLHLHLHTLDERHTTWIRKKVWTHIDNCNCGVQTGCWPLTWDPPYTGQCHKRNFSCQIFIVRHIFPFWCDPIFHEVYPSPICPTPPTLLSHKPEFFFRKSPHFYMITTILYLYLSSGDTWRTGKGILCDLIMSCCNCQYFVIWTYDEPLPIRILIHHYAYWRSRARKHKQINPPDRECKKQS